MMNKKIAIGVVAGLGIAACVAACAKSGTCQTEAEPKPNVWDKMRKGFDDMPDDFPPRVMFDNVAAMRTNTDEILRLLTEQSLAAKV